jgi:hypothetical protein
LKICSERRGLALASLRKSMISIMQADKKAGLENKYWFA